VWPCASRAGGRTGANLPTTCLCRARVEASDLSQHCPQLLRWIWCLSPALRVSGVRRGNKRESKKNKHNHNGSHNTIRSSRHCSLLAPCSRPIPEVLPWAESSRTCPTRMSEHDSFWGWHEIRHRNVSRDGTKRNGTFMGSRDGPMASMSKKWV
jgi:hypothetical protein